MINSVVISCIYLLPPEEQVVFPHSQVANRAHHEQFDHSVKV